MPSHRSCLVRWSGDANPAAVRTASERIVAQLARLASPHTGQCGDDPAPETVPPDAE